MLADQLHQCYVEVATNYNRLDLSNQVMMLQLEFKMALSSMNGAEIRYINNNATYNDLQLGGLKFE